MTGHTDNRGAELLVALQQGLPLVQRPFGRIGAMLGMKEDAVIARVAALFEQGLARRVGAVFNPGALGYRGVLCAVAVEDAAAAGVAAAIAERASVTHAYLRRVVCRPNADTAGAAAGEVVPNLWFTVTERAEAFDAELAELRARTAPAELLAFPASHVFKIGVVLDPSADGSAAAAAPRRKPVGVDWDWSENRDARLDSGDHELVRRLQDDLPLVREPFHAIAREVGCGGRELLDKLRRWEAEGVLRRVAVILRHREVGFLGNGLCAWRTHGAEAARTAGEWLARRSDISHCYARSAPPAFPYDLYAMLHARTPEAAREAFRDVSAAAGLSDGVLLVSVIEYKKTSPRFFPGAGASGTHPPKVALDDRSRGVFPASLLVEGRRCVVVGAGGIALHKARLLLDAKADVTLIAPSAAPEIAELGERGIVRYVPRDFEERDLEGAFLAFAATNDKATNQRVVAACRSRGVLCCSVDGNWSDADFVTPAILRQDGLTVSISTGGASCRRSRFVKETLAKHVGMVESVDLMVMGTSHQCLTLEQREPLHLPGDRRSETGAMVAQVLGVNEFMLLSTCNRVELIAVAAARDDVRRLLMRVMRFEGLPSDAFYVKRGFEAFDHLAALAAGMHSQLPGESHIVAQIKEALDVAVRQGWARGALQEWVNGALHVSKDIRQAVGPLLRGHDIEDLCVQYLTPEPSRPAPPGRIMVIGAGSVGRTLVPRLVELGYDCDWCYRRRKPEVPIGMEERVRLVSSEDLRTHLRAADAVVCAAASTQPILTSGDARWFDSGRNVTVVDLGIPRNVAADAGWQAAHVRVVNLEDLKRRYRAETADVEAARRVSARTTREHAELYEQIVQGLQRGHAGQPTRVDADAKHAVPV